MDLKIYFTLQKFYKKKFTRSIFNYKYNFSPEKFDKLFKYVDENTIKKFNDIIEIIKIDNYYSKGYINPEKITGICHKYDTSNIILIDDNKEGEEANINPILIDYLLFKKNYFIKYLNKINKKKKPVTRELKTGTSTETEYMVINSERLEQEIYVTDLEEKNVITARRLMEKKNVSLKIYVKDCEYKFLGHIIFSNNTIIIKTEVCIINFFKNCVYVILKKKDEESLKNLYKKTLYVKKLISLLCENAKIDMNFDFILSSIVLKISVNIFKSEIISNNQFINIYEYISVKGNTLFINDINDLKNLKLKYNLINGSTLKNLSFESLY